MMSNLYALILCPISQGKIVIELGKDWRIKKTYEFRSQDVSEIRK